MLTLLEWGGSYNLMHLKIVSHMPVRSNWIVTVYSNFNLVTVHTVVTSTLNRYKIVPLVSTKYRV